MTEREAALKELDEAMRTLQIAEEASRVASVEYLAAGSRVTDAGREANKASNAMFKALGDYRAALVREEV